MQLLIIHGQEDKPPIELFKCLETITKSEEGRRTSFKFIVSTIKDMNVLDERFTIDIPGITVREEGRNDVVYTFKDGISAVVINRGFTGAEPRLEVQLVLNG